MQLHKLKVHAPEVIRMIPDAELAKLAKDTKVDYCAKVLTGERMFYLLLYAFLMADRQSQRKLESVFASRPFNALFNYSVDMKVTRSSISTRLSTISLDFFEQSFQLIYNKLSSLYTEYDIRGMNLIRVDSTMVAETCNKLKAGFTVGRKAEGKEVRRQIKYTMAYDGFAAKLAEVFSQPAYLNEDKAMPEIVRALIKKDKDHKNIYVLDRGLKALANYKEFDKNDAVFVGRINTNRKKVESEVWFITNVTNEPGKLQLTAQEIAEAYRRRWDIEVFCRFLKQNLSFSHFMSTSENGIKVILYMTLITAMLIMIYKRLNDIGYTEAKFCFKLEIEEWIIELNVAIRTGELDHRKAILANRCRIP